MPRAVVIGGSVAGLTAALALARVGWQVDVLERDPWPEADDPEQAFACDPRPAVPQAGHTHGLFAGAYCTWRDHAPDVLESLAHAGVVAMPLAANAPPSVAPLLTDPADADLVNLCGRRSTYEWALRRIVRAEDRVTMRAAHVVGLLGDAGPTPRVTGVRLTEGTYDADLVVDASGRRSAAPAWLAALGATADLSWEAQDCEATYYTRYYRLRDPRSAWRPANRGIAAGGPFQAYFAVAFPADRSTFSITVVVPSYVKDFRQLRDPAAFDALARITPMIGPWIDDDYAVGATGVRVIAGFRNAMRRAFAGPPVAMGFVPVGDAFMHTDPTFARGISIATMSAFQLANLVRDHAETGDRAAAWSAYVADQVVPRFDEVVARDAERNDAWSVGWRGADRNDRPFSGDLVWTDLARAGTVDVHIWRALMRVMQVLDRLEDAVTPEVVARARTLRDVGALPVPPAGPTPDEVRSVLAVPVPA